MNIKQIFLLSLSLSSLIPLKSMELSQASQEKPIVIISHTLFHTIEKQKLIGALWHQRENIYSILTQYNINLWNPFSYVTLANLVSLGMKTAKQAKEAHEHGIPSILKKYREALINNNYPGLPDDDINKLLSITIESAFDKNLLKLSDYQKLFNFVLLSEKDVEDFEIIQQSLKNILKFQDIFPLLITRNNYKETVQVFSYKNDNWLTASFYTYQMYYDLCQTLREKFKTQQVYFIDNESKFIENLQKSIQSDNNLKFEYCTNVNALLNKLDEWKPNISEPSLITIENHEAVELDEKSQNNKMVESSDSDDEYEDATNELDVPQGTKIEVGTQTENNEKTRELIPSIEKTRKNDAEMNQSKKLNSYWFIPSKQFVAGVATGALLVTGLWYLKNNYLQK